MEKYKRLTKRIGKGISVKSIRNAISRLAELEDKIENGTIIDTTEKFITEETIKDRKRYLICEHHLIETIVDFADTEAEAEKKIKEQQNENNCKI